MRNNESYNSCFLFAFIENYHVFVKLQYVGVFVFESRENMIQCLFDVYERNNESTQFILINKVNFN